MTCPLQTYQSEVEVRVQTDADFLAGSKSLGTRCSAGPDTDKGCNKVDQRQRMGGQ